MYEDLHVNKASASVSSYYILIVVFHQAYDDTGEVFPIWGECLGLELIAMLVGERNISLGQYDESLFSLTDARNISLKLDLPSGRKKIHSCACVFTFYSMHFPSLTT